MTIAVPTSRPVVVAVVTDQEWCDHLRSVLGSWTALTIVATTRELAHRSASASPDVALWHLAHPSDAGDESVAALRHFRLRSPRTVILAYCAVSTKVAPLLVTAGHAGIDGVLLRGYDDPRDAIRLRLAQDSVDVFTRGVIARMALPDGPAWSVLAHCVRRAARTVLTVEQLADECGVNRKTLGNWLRSAGLPAPEQLIGWSRLLVAAALLEAPDRSIVAVAAQVGFSSEAAFRGMLARYTKLRPRDLRQRDGFARLMAMLENAGVSPLSTSRSPLSV
ncbi:MAG TPA: helix-turn-helix domain-containing protein [Acidimicrobiia bacterium]|nr:helix-turn-helix domain-containing protein [Acidimicrobiia bacterium]